MTDPRPLRLRGEGQPATDILDADGRLLATIYARSGPFTPGMFVSDGLSRFMVLEAYREAEAIAAEIVRAYNAAEDLVSALREARLYVADAGSDEDPETMGHAADLIRDIDAALAKAEGG